MERDPSRLRPDLDPCTKHVAKADAVLEYWAGVFGKSMPTVNFNGRGWGVEPEMKSYHKGGVKAPSRRTVKLRRENIVVYLNSDTYVDTSGSVRTLRCARKPEGRRYEVTGARLKMSGKFYAELWLPGPLLAAPARCPSDRRYSHRRFRRRKCRSTPPASYGEGRIHGEPWNGRVSGEQWERQVSSIAWREGGANGARKTPRATVDSSRGEESSQRDGDGVAGGELDPGPGPDSRNGWDGSGDGSIEGGSKYSTGFWIGGSDSECSDSEGGDSASEAGEDHDEFEF